MITLATGQTVTVTQDVPAGTPIDSIKPPDVGTPVVGVTEVPTPPAASRGRFLQEDRLRAKSDEPVGSFPEAGEHDRAPRSASLRLKSRLRPTSETVESVGGEVAPPRPQAAQGRRRPDPGATRPSRSRCPVRRRSACRTSSSRSSGSRPSCFRSTRPPASSTACAGRSSRRSTRSRPTTAATSPCPRRARSAGCSSCPRPGSSTGSTPTTTASRTPSTRSTRSSPPRGTCAPPMPTRTSSRAVFAYNHADWYVDSVLLRARLIGGLPSDLVGSLTGLTQGHFPIHAKARYADDVAEAATAKRVDGPNAALPVNADLSARASTSSPARTHRSSPSRTAGSCGWAPTPGSASSSSCATCTATRTPTATSSRSRRPTRCRRSARSAPSRSRASSSFRRPTPSRPQAASAGRQSRPPPRR